MILIKCSRSKPTLNKHHPTAQQTLDLLPSLREQVTRELADTSYYHVLEAKGRRIVRRLTPVVKALTFQAEPGAQAVMAAPPSATPRASRLRNDCAPGVFDAS